VTLEIYDDGVGHLEFGRYNIGGNRRILGALDDSFFRSDKGRLTKKAMVVLGVIFAIVILIALWKTLSVTN
jgi:hypothetical protein